MTKGYPRYPTICGDTIVVVAEDDLWAVPTGGGSARRLTAGVAAVTNPALSPDGTLLAFAGAEEGPEDLYLMDAAGGPAQRLTFQGAHIFWVGWDPTGRYIRYAGNAGGCRPRDLTLWQVPRDGGDPEPLPWGLGMAIETDANGLSVISRVHPTRSAAYHKRYRGGTAGHLWVDSDGSGRFRRLPGPSGYLECPQLIDGRIYFLSDHEGYGNVYSCLPDGGDLRRHTDHDDYYARGLAGDGRRLVYHAGGELYLLDPVADRPRRIDVDIPVTQTQRTRKFVSAADYLHATELSPDGARLAVQTRGKLFAFGNWDGPVLQLGDADATNYRLPTWLCDGKRIIAAASDAKPAEILVELDPDGVVPPKPLSGLDVGRADDIIASPTEAVLAVCNHRGELVLVDLTGEAPTSRVLDRCEFGPIDDVVFSPDGRWLAYSRACGAPDGSEGSFWTEINLLDISTGERRPAADRVLSDSRPSFDPGGKYLYFIGHREFNPTHDSLDFDLGFMWGSRPYAVALSSESPAPFVAEPKPLVDADAKKDDEAGEAVSVSVDVDGLVDRVVPFPVAEDRYRRVFGINGKALILSEPPRASSSADIFNVEPPATGVLESVDLATGKVEKLADEVTDAWLGPDGRTLVYQSGHRLRVIKAGEKPKDDDDKPGRESGWIDLDRVKVSVRPDAEWPQMFAEAWRLQAEHFWQDDMGGTDWRAVYERYAPLSHRVASRSELSDLIWETQGELGCSHAYELFGDYRDGPHYAQGYLGAEFEQDADTGNYRITRILDGDRWSGDATSPLHRPGTNVKVGDELLAVNGQPVGRDASPARRLVNLAGEEVRLTVRTGSDEPRTVRVKALGDEKPIRYRDWVEGNRSVVHDATNGRVGYVHVPDMSADGYAEFQRGFLAEHNRQAMIVDFRFNGGGNVSPLVLERLARRRQGMDSARYAKPYPYPAPAPRGPLVGLTNEYAGSDGDLGSHGFKTRGLGPLIGKRTWGGVVGISPRHRLADNTMVTQPEFAIHLDEVGWGIENYGVDPDIDVDFAPQDYAAGRDPQLAVAIETVLSEMEKRPPHEVKAQPKPRLAAPPLPPRPQSGGR